VPIFAIAYCQISKGFYAPYARFEIAGRSDQDEIVRTIEAAIRRTAEKKGSFIEDKWEIVPNSIFVLRLNASSEGTIAFDLSVGARNKATHNGVTLWVAASLGSASRVILPLEGSEPKIRRILEIHETKWAKEFQDPNEELFRENLNALTGVEFLADEDLALSQFFSGTMGDALSVSDSFWRMLYFSAVVITTVGFGDIVPMTGPARSLVATEALAGIVLAGFFLNAIAFRAARRLES
jgi:hypothetical protein